MRTSEPRTPKSDELIAVPQEHPSGSDSRQDAVLARRGSRARQEATSSASGEDHTEGGSETTPPQRNNQVHGTAGNAKKSRLPKQVPGLQKGQRLTRGRRRVVKPTQRRPRKKEAGECVFKVVSANVRSIKNKADEWERTIIKNEIDMVAMQETNLTRDESTPANLATFMPSLRKTYDFLVHKLSAATPENANGQGQGLLTLCHRSLNAIPVALKKDPPVGMQCQAVELKSKTEASQPDFIVNVYMKPQSMRVLSWAQEYFQHLQKIVEFLSKKGKKVLVMGDFNCHTPKLGLECQTDAGGRILEGILRAGDLLLVPQTGRAEPTRVVHTKNGRQESLIDFFLANEAMWGGLCGLDEGEEETRIISCRPRPEFQAGRSDHTPIALTMSLGEEPKKSQKKRRRIRAFKRANMKDLFKSGQDPLNKLASEFQTMAEAKSIPNLDEMAEQAEKVIQQIINDVIPVIEIHDGKHTPWWRSLGDSVSEAVAAKQAAREMWKRAHTPAERQRLFEEYKKKQNKSTATIRKAKETYKTEQAASLQKNHRILMWRHARAILKGPSNAKVGPFAVDDEGRKTESDKEAADALTAEWVRKSEAATSAADTIENDLPPAEVDEARHRSITKEEIRHRLKKIKGSAVPDELTGVIANALGEPFVNMLFHLYQAWWRTNTIPKTFLNNIVIKPLPKAGKDKTTTRGWRPISLTKLIWRVFDACAAERMAEHMENPDAPGARKYPSEMYAYRKQRSCTEMTWFLMEKVVRGWQTGKVSWMLCLDVGSAYDSINPKLLLDKMIHHSKMPPCLVNYGHGLAQPRQVTTKVNGVTGRHAEINGGIPQGLATSTQLFNLFMSDLPDRLQRLKANWGEDFELGMYSDDTRIMIRAHPSQAENVRRALQQAADEMKQWATDWGMKFPHDKQEMIIFSPPGTTTDKAVQEMKILYEGKAVPIKDQIKDLGLWIDNKMTFEKHFEEMRKKLISAKNLIRTMAPYLNESSCRALYNAHVRSVLEFGAVIWANMAVGGTDNAIRVLNRIQREAAQALAHVSEDVAGIDACLMAGIDAVVDVVDRQTLRFFAKMRRKADPRHPGKRALQVWTREASIFSAVTKEGERARGLGCTDNFPLWLAESAPSAVGRKGAGTAEKRPKKAEMIENEDVARGYLSDTQKKATEKCGSNALCIFTDASVTKGDQSKDLGSVGGGIAAWHGLEKGLHAQMRESAPLEVLVPVSRWAGSDLGELTTMSKALRHIEAIEAAIVPEGQGKQHVALFTDYMPIVELIEQERTIEAHKDVGNTILERVKQLRKERRVHAFWCPSHVSTGGAPLFTGNERADALAKEAAAQVSRLSPTEAERLCEARIVDKNTHFRRIEEAIRTRMTSEWVRTRAHKNKFLAKLVEYKDHETGRVRYRELNRLEKPSPELFSRSTRHQFTRLRAGRSELEGTTLPFKQQDNGECTKCQTSKNETEEHFLCECKAWDAERKAMLDKVAKVTNAWPTAKLLLAGIDGDKILDAATRQAIVDAVADFLKETKRMNPIRRPNKRSRARAKKATSGNHARPKTSNKKGKRNAEEVDTSDDETDWEWEPQAAAQKQADEEWTPGRARSAKRSATTRGERPQARKVKSSIRNGMDGVESAGICPGPDATKPHEANRPKRQRKKTLKAAAKRMPTLRETHKTQEKQHATTFWKYTRNGPNRQRTRRPTRPGKQASPGTSNSPPIPIQQPDPSGKRAAGSPKPDVK